MTESLTKIKCIDSNYPIFKDIKYIKLLCLNKDSLKLLITINIILNLSKAKANLLFLGQLSKQKVDMKTRNLKMYLH